MCPKSVHFDAETVGKTGFSLCILRRVNDTMRTYHLRQNSSVRSVRVPVFQGPRFRPRVPPIRASGRCAFLALSRQEELEGGCHA